MLDALTAWPASLMANASALPLVPARGVNVVGVVGLVHKIAESGVDNVPPTYWRTLLPP
jgi:hypothetical protein